MGRIDIANAVTLLSTHLTTARQGHLQQALHIFSYLRSYPESDLILDTAYMSPPTNPNLKEWYDFYPNATEPMPRNAPPPKGNPVSTTCYVDADWAGDSKTRRSHTGVLLFVNHAPIQWFSKKQTTVETSTHGAELVATRIAVDMVDALRYKLRTFGIPLDGPTLIYCDNQSVVHNGTRPESTLRKSTTQYLTIEFEKRLRPDILSFKKAEQKKTSRIY